MANSFDPDHWERVAAELRSLRDAQQQTWGTIDNATLGRYLADEVSGDERRQIEQVLDERPDLRKLTDLVRDVLVEFEPVSVPAAPAVEPADLSAPAGVPALLPFSPKASPRPPRRVFGRTFQQRAALVAAACLLLALGLSLRGLNSTSPNSATLGSDTRAERLPLPNFLSVPTVDQLEKRVAELTKQDKVDEALKEADKVLVVAEKARGQDDANYVGLLNRMGRLYQQQGQLAKAEPAFRRAYSISRAKLGADHPETVQSANNLANSYQVALNFAPNGNPYLSANDNPYFSPVGSHKMSPFHGAYAVPARSDTDAPLARGGAMQKKAEERARQEAPVVTDRVLRQSPTEVKEVVVPVLTRGLNEARGPHQRLAYIQALGRLGPAARDAVPALARALETADPAERQAVVLALGQMGPSADNALPLLTEALKSPAAPIRSAAANAILQYGPEGLNALHDLVARGDARQKAEAEKTLLTSQADVRCCAGLKDTCYLFSPQTANQTQRALVTMARNRGMTVYAETAAAPTSKAKVREGKDGKDLVLTTEGVYLLICKEPPRVELHVSARLLKQGFTARKQLELRQVIEQHLQKGEYDTALNEGVRYLDQFAEARDKKK